MEAKLLNHICLELAEELTGAIVKKVHGPDRRTLVLRFFRRGKESALIISTEPEAPRMHLTVSRPENPKSPPRFASLLRSRLTNALVERIEAEEGERIVLSGFVRKEDGTQTRYKLVVELTGKSANVILVDEHEKIVDALKYFPEGSARVVLPGEEFMELKSAGIEKAVGEKEPPFGPIEGSWNRGADAYYSALSESRTTERLKGELRRIVKGAEKKARRKLKNLLGDRERAEEGLKGEILGGLLLTNIKQIERGMEAIEVEDYTMTPAEKIRVTLDPKLAPNENIDRLFKRVKKSKTALKLLEGRIPESEEEISYLEGLLFSIDTAEDSDVLYTIKEELRDAGLVKKVTEEKPGKKGAPKPQIKTTEPIERTAISSGTEMLIGKSGAGNDLLIKKYARPTDLWFHAKGFAGAHVLLKPEGKKEPSEKDIEEAARAAALRSRARTETKAEVIYTEARNVKKPKGAKPGMVRVKEYRSIVVKTEG